MIKSRKIRAGLYAVTAGPRTLHVEQIRTDTPGYGVENRWWISDADNLGRVHFDSASTKAEALAGIAYAHKHGHLGFAAACDCMTEEDPLTGDERVLTHSSTCALHPDFGFSA
jgi:hypothetical protein